MTADDADGDDLNYSIYGWYYMDLFEINATTGDLSFKTTPDYETPTDNHGRRLWNHVSSERWSGFKTKPCRLWSKTKTAQPQSNQASPWRFPRTKPRDSLSRSFSASDLDANASLSFFLVDGIGSKDNPLFSLDENGTLSSAVIFDYENNQSNYSIRVKVTDEHNAYLEKTFAISLLNEIEDLDGDGVEDFYDADDDNDGFSDVAEIAYGSDPRDADSVANAAPARS